MEMKPGRELDVLVATHVMRWHEYVDSNPKEVIRTQGDTADHPCAKCGSYYGHGIKPYSTDIAAAWEVVEKIGTEFAIERWPDYKGGIIRASFNRQHEWSKAVTAPHAICLAALKAVGVTVGTFEDGSTYSISIGTD